MGFVCPIDSSFTPLCLGMLARVDSDRHSRLSSTLSRQGVGYIQIQIDSVFSLLPSLHKVMLKHKGAAYH